MRNKRVSLATMFKLYPLWGTPIRMILLVLAALALVAFAFFTLAILLPIALVVGLGLHFYLRYRLRHARNRTPGRSRDGAIDVEYTVIERR
jgi:Flp pilus assembly protein TadB